MKRITTIIGPAVAAIVLLTSSAGSPPALAGQRPSASVEKEAIAALENMGRYLRTLKTFQIEGTTTRDTVLNDGQKVQTSGNVMLLARIPDRLRVSIESDRHDRLLIYDGKQFSMHARRANTYATVPAPPTIGQLADVLEDKYGVELPLVDLFHWGSPHSTATAQVTSAMLVGPSQVGGVTCGHYIYRQDGVDWQVWIQQGEYPLPRRLVITTLTDEARPQYTATLNWNLAPSFDDQAFVFTPPKGAGRAVLAELKQEVKP
jgi:hypothetical protein